jgi:hypothetical protein
MDTAIASAQLASMLPDPRSQLPLYERSLALREQVAAADPADRFAQAVWRRALVQVAATRLEIGDRAKAYELAEQAMAAFERDDPATDPKPELRWRASAALVSAVSAPAGGDAGRACRRLAQGAADVAVLRRAGQAKSWPQLDEAHAALPHCAAANRH